MLVDLYVTSQTPEENGSGAPDARADRIRGKLGPIPPAVDRVAVAVRRPDGEEGGWPDWFTFRGGPDGQAVEDRTQRGWHPLVAERLGVWRFSGFELTRLPARSGRAPVPYPGPRGARRPAARSPWPTCAS